jgi:hypothetical protein
MPLTLFSFVRRTISNRIMSSTLTSCRWAFDVSKWEPSEEEWCKAMQSVQTGNFLFFRPMITCFEKDDFKLLSQIDEKKNFKIVTDYSYLQLFIACSPHHVNAQNKGSYDQNVYKLCLFALSESR